jgi:hypothetical protein
MAKQRTKVVTMAGSTPTGSVPGPIEAQKPLDSSSVAALAYQLWHARGCPDGSPETDWFQAERELSSQSFNPESSSTKQSLFTRQVSA